MDKLAPVIDKFERSSLAPEHLYIYLKMRADIATDDTNTPRVYKPEGKLVSGVTVKSLARILSLPEATCERYIKTLIHAGWVAKEDEYYLLGTTEDTKVSWLFNKEEPKKDKVSKDLRSALNDTKRRKLSESMNRILTKQTKQQIIADVTKGTNFEEEKKPSKFLLYYNNNYHKVFKEAAPMPTGDDDHAKMKKAYVFAGRFVKWAGGSTAAAEGMYQWILDNWDPIKANLNLDKPTLSTIATKRIFDKLSLYKEAGIPLPQGSRKTQDHVSRRADEKALEEQPTEF